MKKILMLLCLALAASSCNDFTTSTYTETKTRLVSIYPATTGTVQWFTFTENEYTYYVNVAIYGPEPTEPLKFTLQQINFPAAGIPEAARLQIGEAGVTYEDLSKKVFEFAPGEKSLLVPIVLFRDDNRLYYSNPYVWMSGWKTVLKLVPLTDDLRVIGGSFTLTEKR